MFERRLKIFLGLLAVVSLLLVARAGQVQVVEAARWRKAAAESIRRSQLVEAVRGNIYDVQGRLIATDQPCTDACVDYRALSDPPDETWVNERSAERLRNRLGDDWLHLPKKQRKERAVQESDNVRADIHRMWADLARLSGKPLEQIEEARSAIVRRVQMRRRLVWYHNYLKARDKSDQNKKLSPESDSVWRRWLVEEEAPAGPELDNFSVSVAEQTESHVVLHAISTDVQNELGKHIERYPGLVLRPSTHRYYPFGSAFCHGMGHVGHVNHEDLLADPNPKDETRQYLPNDLIGRAGVEGLCEQALRGTKGKIEHVLGDDTPVARSEPVSGKDVRLSIDIELQAELEKAFTHAEIYDANKPASDPPEIALLHGAAIVIDVPTGEVRALASYPTYDLNRFDDDYDNLHADQLNNPLFNRATESQLQPGSTVKPMVGLSAITQGLATPEEEIECTGYLVIDGKRRSRGRCWVASKFFDKLQGQVAHHPVPSAAPHPTGFLNFADALERSCNVYFENMADRLGMEGLSVWFDRWGLGRPTGIGIPEAHGQLPRAFDGPPSDRRGKTWFSGIGQDPVEATPIQMANVAATIARDGLWMRPRLLSDADAAALGIHPAPPKAAATAGGDDSQASYPDKVDLNLSKAGLAAAHDGMHRVTSTRAGTGLGLLSHAPPELAAIPFCGKTGTATAPRFLMKVMGEDGKPMRQENGKPVYYPLDPSTATNPNSVAPWYRGNGTDGKDINHAWYIGFAPADHPKIAFAVMVEYGGSGGASAGAVAREAMVSCVKHHYLTPADAVK